MGTRPHRSIMEKQLGRGIALTTRPFTLSLLFFRFCWEEIESQGPLLLPADRIDPSSRSPLLSVEYNTSASPSPWRPAAVQKENRISSDQDLIVKPDDSVGLPFFDRFKSTWRRQNRSLVRGLSLFNRWSRVNASHRALLFADERER